MRLYDTARGEVVPFEPGPVVTMYTCGITPYDATHLGHAAAYLTYDVLQRRLRDRGHDTKCVRNITDVDDDLLRKARELGVHYLDLAAAETASPRCKSPASASDCSRTCPLASAARWSGSCELPSRFASTRRFSSCTATVEK